MTIAREHESIMKNLCFLNKIKTIKNSKFSSIKVKILWLVSLFHVSVGVVALSLFCMTTQELFWKQAAIIRRQTKPICRWRWFQQWWARIATWQCTLCHPAFRRVVVVCRCLSFSASTNHIAQQGFRRHSVLLFYCTAWVLVMLLTLAWWFQLIYGMFCSDGCQVFAICCCDW